jgi:hypothetical protein
MQCVVLDFRKHAADFRNEAAFSFRDVPQKPSEFRIAGISHEFAIGFVRVADR